MESSLKVILYYKNLKIAGSIMEGKMGINEDNFIRELNNKNPKALEYAFNSYCDYIYNVAFGVFGSEQYSTYIDECINDIFMCLWNNIESFDEEKGNFKYWFKAVAKYKAINYKKKIIKNANVECIEDYMFESKIKWKI